MRRAIQALETALAIRKRLLPISHVQLSQSYRCLGLAYAELGFYKKALDFYQQALICDEMNLSAAKWSTSITLRNMGLMCDYIGDYYQATQYFSETMNNYRECMRYWRINPRHDIDLNTYEQ